MQWVHEKLWTCSLRALLLCCQQCPENSAGTWHSSIKARMPQQLCTGCTCFWFRKPRSRLLPVLIGANKEEVLGGQQTQVITERQSSQMLPRLGSALTSNLGVPASLEGAFLQGAR
jgi:hypothetical protein